MKIRVYAVQDELAGRFGQPFCLASDEMALRHFRQMMSGIVQQETYVLFCLGVYDDETGDIESDVRPVAIKSVPGSINAGFDEPNSKQAADSQAAHERTSVTSQDESAHDSTLAEALDTAPKRRMPWIGKH